MIPKLASQIFRQSTAASSLIFSLTLLDSFASANALSRNGDFKQTIQRRQTTRHDIIERSARRSHGPLRPRASTQHCKGPLDPNGNCCGSSDIHYVDGHQICCPNSYGQITTTPTLQCCPSAEVYRPTTGELLGCCHGVTYANDEQCCATSYGSITVDGSCCASANVYTSSSDGQNHCCSAAGSYVDASGANACCDGGSLSEDRKTCCFFGAGSAGTATDDGVCCTSTVYYPDGGSSSVAGSTTACCSGALYTDTDGNTACCPSSYGTLLSGECCAQSSVVTPRRGASSFCCAGVAYDNGKKCCPNGYIQAQDQCCSQSQIYYPQVNQPTCCQGTIFGNDYCCPTSYGQATSDGNPCCPNEDVNTVKTGKQSTTTCSCGKTPFCGGASG